MKDKKPFTPEPTPPDQQITLSEESATLAAAFCSAYNDLAARHHVRMVAKGFWEKPRNDGEGLLLMVTEICEGFEGLRNNVIHSDKIPDFSPMEEELADLILRVMDYGKGRKLRIAEALIAKMVYNLGRPYKHGKTC